MFSELQNLASTQQQVIDYDNDNTQCILVLFMSEEFKDTTLQSVIITRYSKNDHEDEGDDESRGEWFRDNTIRFIENCGYDTGYWGYCSMNWDVGKWHIQNQRGVKIVVPFQHDLFSTLNDLLTFQPVLK
jgi:hypothetical protein